MNITFKVESAIRILEQEANEHGGFSIIDKGFEILPDDYLDFWRWLFDDRDFFEDEVLSKIAGYISSEEMQSNKSRLYDYVKSSAIGKEWELPELLFCREMPIYSYEEYRKNVAAEAENILHRAIEKYWQSELGGCLEEYMQEWRAIMDTVKEASGEKHFMIPNIFSVKRCDGGIMLTIKPVNIDYVGMTHVYDIDWKFPVTKYAYILYRYVLDGKGKVVIDIEGRNEIPVYDFQDSSKQEDYFLFLYRLLKLEKCYQWLILSDIIKKAVHTFEQDLLRIGEAADSFIRMAGIQTYRKSGKPVNYHEKILESMLTSGEIVDVLEAVTGKYWMREDIKRKFRVNLYRGDFKNKNRCLDIVDIDFWAIQSDTFYGMNLYWNDYDSMIDKVFFYANYLGDMMEGGLFESIRRTDKELSDIKNAVLLVLMTKKQESIFFREWIEFSEQAVEKVKIILRNV